MNADANSSGAPASGGCPSCHNGGSTPTVTLTPANPQVPPGQTITFTVTVSTPNGSHAGFWLMPSAGSLSDPGPGVQILGNYATHTTPKIEDASGNVTFTVDWTAPASPMNVTVTAWGNSVNLSGDPTGDGATSTSTTVTVTCPIWYQDGDGDGFGDMNNVLTSCTQPAGYVSVAGDCDDNDANVHPGASEFCNGVDDDCDGQVDENAVDAATWYRDQDNDGFGTPSTTLAACSQPVGYVSNDDDCNDTVASIHPSATEVCNLVDDNCDGQIDEGLPTQTYYADADGDTYGDPAMAVTACMQPPMTSTNNLDCDDGNAATNPGAPEMCDFADNDCDGLIDDGLPTQTFYADLDNDGVGGSMTVTACGAPPGHVAITGDCDDTNPAVKPGAAELCNMEDDDCDGQVDEGVRTTFFRDADGDGFGDPADTVEACGLPAGYAANSMDCDDTDGSVHPGAAETCDDRDEDCDGVNDNGVPVATCGLGACMNTGTTCHPSSCTPLAEQSETCNGIDDDCDGVIDNDPDALCPGDEVCIMGACELPADGGLEPDAGTSAPSDGGSDEVPEEPAGGCGCTSTGGSALVLVFGTALLAVVPRRRGVRRLG